jgi:DNA polymerase III epsilon subunit-like protein
LSAKILLFDLETQPALYYAWRLWDTNALEVLEYTKVISFSAKWLEGKQVTKALCDYRGNREKSLLKDLWELITEADIIVAHNGKAFDFGRMNTSFLKYDFPPPAPTQKIDTRKMAKEVFGFDSTSLDNLAQFLGLGNKMATGGYELWKQCRANDPAAWAKMKKYNAHDVRLLEKIYLKLRPWVVMHPNLNLYSRGEGCPRCGGPDSKIHSRGEYQAKTRMYRRFQCQTCNGWLKEAVSIKGVKAKYVGV